MSLGRLRLPQLLAITFLVLAVSLTGAPAQLLGPEFQINSYTTGRQTLPKVAAAGAGGFVVVWESYYQDGSWNGVFGQLFDSSGLPLGSEFRVNTHTTSGQNGPAVGADAAGGFVVVWESAGQDGSYGGVFGQRFGSDGQPVAAEFQVNTYTTSDQMAPEVAVDSAGGFVVAWTSPQDGYDLGVFGQRFDQGGVPAGSEFQVNGYTIDFQSLGGVAADGAGDFVVVWQSYRQDGSNNGVFGQRFESSGLPSGGEFRINTWTTSGQQEPAVASDRAGNFVVAWSSDGQDGSRLGVFGQRFDSAGSPAGSEFRINSYTPQVQRSPAVAADVAGNFVVVWVSWTQDGSEDGVFAQRYDRAGLPLGHEFRVNSQTPGQQTDPHIAADSAGNFIVVWQADGQDGSSYSIFGQRLLSSAVFADGFDTGDFGAWSFVCSAGEICP